MERPTDEEIALVEEQLGKMYEVETDDVERKRLAEYIKNIHLGKNLTAQGSLKSRSDMHRLFRRLAKLFPQISDIFVETKPLLKTKSSGPVQRRLSPRRSFRKPGH